MLENWLESWATIFHMQFFAHVLRVPEKEPSPPWKSQMELQDSFFNSVLPVCCSRLGSEPGARWFFSLYVTLCFAHKYSFVFFFLTELFLSIACEVKVFISSCWNLGITWTGFWLICKSLIWSYVVCSCKVKEILSVKLSKSIWFAFRSNLWFLWVLLCTLSPKPATRNWIRMLVWAKTQTDFHVGF